MYLRGIAALTVFAAAILTAGCGGGGGNTAVPATTSPAPLSPTTVTTSTPIVSAQGGIPKVVSLTVGASFPIFSNQSSTVEFASDNSAVQVDPKGVLHADPDVAGQKRRATISVARTDGTKVATTAVTIVDWVANHSSLVTVANPAVDNILLVEGDSVYFTQDSQLMVSNDGMRTAIKKGSLPDSLPTRLLKTPYGYFLRTMTGVYRSSDLANWSLECTVRTWSLYHMFSYYYDSGTQKCYLYTGEYSTEPQDLHAVYRGTYASDGTAEWKKILEFDSLANSYASKTGLQYARHVHTVDVDPYTGQVWVGTGDSDIHARIMYSDDHGDTFRIVGIGDQMWRTVSIWFTEDYVYWNMDATVAQSIWRIPRSVYAEHGIWPDMTPELSSGTTSVGRKYLVTAMYDTGRFPVARGYSYLETTNRVLGGNDRVLAVDDPSLQYFERVAMLDNGSQWFHCWATDAAGEKVLLMGASPEGALRDWNGRVFGIKERPGTKPDVQELVSVQSPTPDTYQPYTQLEPRGQTTSGDIYFVGRETPYRIYKMKLDWHNQ